jgi:signal peptidase I
MNVRVFLRKHLSFFVLVIGLFSVRWSFAESYHVPTGSMEPTVHVGDRILANKAAYDLKIPFTDKVLWKTGEPARGDIIVFRDPRDESTILLKRLIGLPGDEIEIQDGFIRVNGELVQGTLEGVKALQGSNGEEVVYYETFAAKKASIRRTPNMFRREHLRFHVPAEKYFAMGDNRDNSADSRSWGFFPRVNLKGKAVNVLWHFKLADRKPEFELARYGSKLN